MQAFFTDGNSLDIESIVKIGTDAGLDEDSVRKVVTDDNKIKHVFTAAQKWSHAGVSGS